MSESEFVPLNCSPPFGHFAPPAWAQHLMQLCQRLPDSWLGRRIAFVLRKPILRRSQQTYDAIVLGKRWRLYPHQNLSDKRLLCTPWMLDGAERTFLARLLPANALVVDVGANIGGYSLQLAHQRTDLRVVLVEPDPDMVARIACNIVINELQSRCTIVRAAITAQPGEVVLHIDRANRGQSAIVNADREGEQIRVPGLPLSDLFGAQGIEHIDLLKLDIEGHEQAALSGLFGSCTPDLWPDWLQIEQYRDQAETPAVRLALSHGYKIALRTRMNLILHRG